MVNRIQVSESITRRFPPFFGQVAKPRFWQDTSPTRREFGNEPETEEAFG